MIEKQNKIPRRLVQPESHRYIKLTKLQFVELISGIKGIIENQTQEKQNLTINIDGFDGGFSDANDLVNTLDSSEWKKLSSISVSYTDLKQYNDRLKIKLGGYSFARQGVRIEYGSGNTDPVRMAIKESLDRFIKEYIKIVWLDDRVVPYGSGIITGILFLYWIFNVADEKVLKNLNLWNYVSITSFAWIFGLIVYTLTFWAHRRAYPHFETLAENGSSRFSFILKISGYVVGAVGFVSAGLAIYQVLTNHK